MAGHSKWANIKRKKEVNDKARAKIFAKLSRAITMAVSEGGGMSNPEFNVRLRIAIEKAKQEDMPKENIERAIEKGSGSSSSLLKEVKYEAFGPEGVSFIILGSTDNPNRSYAELRNVLERNGGKMGAPGSVSYLYEQCGAISFDITKNSEENILIFADKVEVKDIEQEESISTVFFPFEKLGEVSDLTPNLIVESGPDAIYRPMILVEVNNPETKEQIMNLIEIIEDLDDVQEVFSNVVFY
jgi:YebC/PmpR family DNA-binding regulatory protein